MEDAGYTREALQAVKTSSFSSVGGQVGVFAGVMYEEYQLFGVEESLRGNPLAMMGSPSSIANRVSYYLNLHGPSMAVDTMCSSSLTAIHLAMESIYNGSCGMAIAGGVNLSVHPNKYKMLSQHRFVSDKGRCESFGEGGNGYVPAEGVGAVLLKPLAKAQADGDRIYGVIRGSSLNHGGKTNGYTVPNPKAQAAVIKEAIGRSGLKPEDFSYIEAHGTGTSLGDPIEIAGLSKAFESAELPGQYCAIGSVKSNIGHAESAAGIAGVTKILLQLQYKKLVPSLHSATLNNQINFKKTPFKVQQKLEDWQATGGSPRIAGISSFGAGGSNAHLVIEEFLQPVTAYVSDAPAIMLLSARNTARLKVHVENLSTYLKANRSLRVYDVAYTLQIGRSAMEERLAFLAGSTAETLDVLERYIAGDTTAVFAGNAKSGRKDFLLEGNAGRSYIETALRDKETKLLMQWWVNGGSIDWNLLYKGKETPNRIALPTYPFERKRYWFDTSPGSQGTEKVKAKAMASENNKVSLQPLSVDFPADQHRIEETVPESVYLLPVGRTLEELSNGLSTLLTEALYLDELVDVEQKFIDYGMDSITGIEFVKSINQAYGLNLSATDLYDHPTVRRFAEFALSKLPEKLPLTTLPDSIPLSNPLDSDRLGYLVERVQNLAETRLQSISVSDPLPGQVQVRVMASAINFPDVMCVQGLYPTMPAYPFVPGFEVAGKIVKTGDERDRHLVGREVIALTGEQLGGHGKFVNVNKALLIRKPQNLTFADACSLPVVFMTVYYALKQAGLKRGDKVLIQTAAGGCGLMAVQLAHLIGAVPYGTSSRRYKLDFLEAIGVSQQLNYKSAAFEEEMRQMSGHSGFDVVLNMLSGPMIQSGLDLLGTGGRYLELAVHALKSSPRLDLSGLTDNQSFKSIDLRKLLLAEGPSAEKQILRLGLETMVQWVESGAVFPVVSRVYPFSKISEAMAYVASGAHIGKVVISHNQSEMTDHEEVLKQNLVRQKMSAPEYSIDLHPSNPVQIPEVGPLARSRHITTAERSMDIAIIGMAARLPGADNTDEFWENLKAGKSGVVEIGTERWNPASYYHPDPAMQGKSYSKWMGALKDIDKFDPLFFNISPREAELMDPQQRLFLQESWKAIEDAGYTPADLWAQKCGVFIGAATGDYNTGAEQDAHTLMGRSTSILSARISYLLNLKGPCLTIDTACSSSLVAIAQACDSLVNGHSNLALAGGVTVLTTPDMHIMTSKAGMLSEDGQCHTFDQKANGFVPAEGVGVLVMKPLLEAEQAGDRIYGVIKGWNVNQDGATNGITAPSKDAQVALEKGVYDRFDIHPQTISYVEAHGTGTKLGDPIEVRALRESFEAFTQRKGYCGLGSVKSNIGHALAAAGVSGVVKVLLGLRHQQLPPTLNFKELNEHIDLDESPFYVNTELKPWITDAGQLRRAAVSSFGFSGTNAHLVIEEYLQKDSIYQSGNPAIILLSAQNAERLKQQAANLIDYLDVHKDLDLYDVAYTLQIGRKPMEERLAFVADNIDELRARLRRFRDGAMEGLFRSNINEDRPVLSLNGGAGQAYLNYAVQHKELESLAQLWVQGVSIDWRLLYDDSNHPNKVSLPTYPFARDRYWLDQTGSTNVSDSIGKLHPLVHRNESDLESQKFESTFTGKERFLAEHQINREKILPGVAYLELAREAGYRSSRRPITGMSDVRWLNPIKVDGRSRQIQIRIQESNEWMEYQIFSEQSGEEVLHSEGRLTSKGVHPPLIDLKAVQGRLADQLSGAECYEIFRERGLDLGAGFQGIKTLYYSETEALSSIQLPIEKEFVLQPGILDSALQTCIGLSLGQPVVGLNIPFSIGQVHIYGDLDRDTWCYARKNRDNPDQKLSSFDVYLLSGAGEVLLGFEDFVALPVDGIQKSSTGPSLHLYGNQWKKAAYSTPLKSAGHQCVVLAGGSKQLAEKLAEMTGREVIPINEVSETDFFARTQTLVQSKIALKEEVHLLLLYGHANYVTHGFISGLFKTAQLEHYRFEGKTVGVNDLSMEASGTLADIIRNEGFGSGEVRYVQGEREVRAIRKLSEERVQAFGIKEEGVYLITGGAGGLGQLFAAHLAERHVGKVILTGRKEESGLATAELEALQAVYYSCDIADEDAVKGLVEKVMKENGRLDGIFHSAGVLRDGLIVNQTKATSVEVLAPKIMGARNLDEITKDLDLDFIVYFSSLAGVLGNMGQAAYASANAWLDNHASYRNDLVAQGKRKGNTISFNWPLWAAAGMSMDAETEKFVSQQWGMAGLPADRGLQVMNLFLGQKLSQVIVTYGEATQISARLLGPVATGSFFEAEHRGSQRAELQPLIEQRIRELAAQILKLEDQKISLDKQFGAYGFDSILLTKLVNELNAHYSIDLLPTVFYNYPSIRALSGFLAADYPGQMGLKHNSKPKGELPNSTTPDLPSAKSRFSQSKRKTSRSREANTGEPIAIIGMSGRFPGSPDLTAYWENIQANKDLIAEVPADRWDWRSIYGDAGEERGKTKAKWGGFITDMDKFDSLFFNISPREAEQMDPQHRISLEATYHALEDAGLSPLRVKGSNTGVFIGVSSNDYYMLLNNSSAGGVGAYTTMGIAHTMLVNRISYLLDVHGPSEPIDTACSSSLIAIHRAVENIRSGRCDLAIGRGSQCNVEPGINHFF